MIIVLCFQEFMVRLTVEQNRIGQIVQAGSLLLTDSTTSEDAARQIEAQMSLLNTHWEDLRIHAMDRQTRYALQFCALYSLDYLDVQSYNEMIFVNLSVVRCSRYFDRNHIFLHKCKGFFPSMFHLIFNALFPFFCIRCIAIQ